MLLGSSCQRLHAGAAVGERRDRVGNTMEAVAGAWSLRSAGFLRATDRVRDVLALAGRGALASTAISASVEVRSLWQSHILPDTQIQVVWAIW
jgi:hypothetical protein